MRLRVIFLGEDPKDPLQQAAADYLSRSGRRFDAGLVPLKPTKRSKNGDDAELSSYLNILYEQRWLIAGLTFLVLLIGTAYALLARPVYEANVLIHVEEDPLVMHFDEYRLFRTKNGPSPLITGQGTQGGQMRGTEAHWMTTLTLEHWHQHVLRRK